MLRSQFTSEELKDAWEKSGTSFATFESFVTQLALSGILAKKKTGGPYDFGIASLYIDGLGMTRVQGEKK